MTAIRLELGDFGFDPRHPDGKVRLTTTSLGPEAMTRLAAVLNSPLIHSVGPADEPPRFTVEEPRFDRDGIRTAGRRGPV